jgi:hypothetical protein
MFFLLQPKSLQPKHLYRIVYPVSFAFCSMTFRIHLVLGSFLRLRPSHLHSMSQVSGVCLGLSVSADCLDNSQFSFS